MSIILKIGLFKTCNVTLGELGKKISYILHRGRNLNQSIIRSNNVFEIEAKKYIYTYIWTTCRYNEFDI